MTTASRQPPTVHAQGFTLLEVLVSILIIAISAASFMWLQKSTWQISKGANKMLISGQIIQSALESLRDSIALDSTVFTKTRPASDTLPAVNGVTVYRTFSAPGTNMPAPNYNVRMLRLTAKWTGWKPDSLVVITYLAKHF